MANQVDTDGSPPKRMKLGEKPSEENAETGNKTSIMDLPDELKIGIFKHLLSSDIKNVALVCKEFHRISKDSELITDLCFEDHELYNLENEVRSLQKLSIESVSMETKEEFEKKVKPIKDKLQKITLHGINNEDQIDPFIEEMKDAMTDKEKFEIDLVRRAEVSNT